MKYVLKQGEGNRINKFNLKFLNGVLCLFKTVSFMVIVFIYGCEYKDGPDDIKSSINSTTEIDQNIKNSDLENHKKWFSKKSDDWVRDFRSFLQLERWGEKNASSIQGKKALHFIDEFVETGDVEKLSLAKVFLLEASNANDAIVFGWLGLFSYTGLLEERDLTKANEYWTKGAEIEDPRSLYYTAARYDSLDDFGYEKNKKKAYDDYLNAANKGSRSSMFSLARIYEGGSEAVGIAKNNAKYLYYIKKSSKLGNLSALVNLNFHYRYIDNVSEDVFRTGKELCDTNTVIGAVGCSSVGQYFYQGKEDYVKAAEWFERGWQQGNDITSAANYGVMLYDLVIEGVLPQNSENIEKTKFWLERGCGIEKQKASPYLSDLLIPVKMLLSLACHRLGNIYVYGELNSEIDYEKAENYYLECQFREGICYTLQADLYIKGHLKYSDPNKKVLEILNRGVYNMDVLSMTKLGLGYSLGLYGLNKDFEKAYELFQRSADLGWRTAYVALSLYYRALDNPDYYRCSIYGHLAKKRITEKYIKTIKETLDICESKLSVSQRKNAIKKANQLHAIYPWKYPKGHDIF